jgi:hypothetical protein
MPPVVSKSSFGVTSGQFTSPHNLTGVDPHTSGIVSLSLSLSLFTNFSVDLNLRRYVEDQIDIYAFQFSAGTMNQMDTDSIKTSVDAGSSSFSFSPGDQGRAVQVDPIKPT